MKLTYLFAALVALTLTACTSSDEESQGSSRVVVGSEDSGLATTSDDATASGEFVRGPVALEGFFKESTRSESQGNSFARGTDFNLSRLNQEITRGVLDTAVGTTETTTTASRPQPTTSVPVATIAPTTQQIQTTTTRPTTTVRKETTTTQAPVVTAPPTVPSTNAPVITAPPTTKKPVVVNPVDIVSAAAIYRRGFVDKTQLMVSYATTVSCDTGNTVAIRVIAYNASGEYVSGISRRVTCRDARASLNGVFENVPKSNSYTVGFEADSDLGSDRATLRANEIDVF